MSPIIPFEKVYPEVVKTNSKTEFKSVAYQNLIAPITEAIKTLYRRIVGIENLQATQARQIASKADTKALNVANAKIQKLEAENSALKLTYAQKTQGRLFANSKFIIAHLNQMQSHDIDKTNISFF